ncbi:MAG: hypothetical protein FIB02_02320 [Desulfuromonas sp.]|nr:hypothetical protein [Desulfuromonas sp.]
MVRSPFTVQFLVALFAAIPLFAGDVLAKEAPAGSVVAARGTVEASDAGGAVRPLKIKSEIYAPDTVRTGKDGRTQLIFSDNTLVSLGVSSVLQVAEYQWNAEQKSGAMKTRVEEGTFRVLGGLITKTAPKNFTTETPAATIGIRGSMYAGKVTGGETIVVFLGGKGIVVFNPKGRVEITRPGYGVRVRLGEAPGDPVPFSIEELAQLIESLTPGAAGALDRAFQVSDRTTDFDKRTEDNLPFDPNGFSVPLGDLIGDVFTVYGQEHVPPRRSALGGTITLTGTAVGLFLGEKPAPGFVLIDAIAAAGGANRYLVSGFGLMDDLEININRDTGAITGCFEASEGEGLYLSPDIGYERAVYFNDQAFSAGLSCLDGACVDSAYNLNSGGYLMTETDAQFSPYLSWGYWGASYTDADGTTFQTYVPGSLWLAGVKTPDDYINGLLATANFTATYEGPAYGVRVDDLAITTLTGGATTLHADFANGLIDGSIVFDQHTINFNGEFAGVASSFYAWDADDGDFGTSISGAFYGPQANAVGGSFESRNFGAVAHPETYQGIFGGNLTGTAPSPVP